MIGLISGTSEGKEILSLLNKYTEDIFVSTATTYGGDLVKDYKYKVLNTKPLKYDDMVKAFKENNINILIDGSHPYAIEVSQNAMKICDELKIQYVRYERPSIVDKFKDEEKVIEVDSYEDLYDKLKNINGTILNTTGSRNIDKVLALNIENRIVHRVLPSLKVMEECFEKGVKVEDLIAIKGPISYQLNCSFIREYNGKAMLLKDSGPQGGTEEKIKAAIDMGIWAFVVDRKKIEYSKVFYDIVELVKYVLEFCRGTYGEF